MIAETDQSLVDLRNLRALVAVADQGSFRGAARSLGYTQSAISHQIALLERGLDAPMFIRPGGRGAITLTPAGDAVYRRARRVLGEVQTLSADVAAIQSGERQTLRIGVFQTATTELLPGALRALREQRPDVEVVLSEIDDNARTFDQMAAGRLELAFLVNPEPDDRIQSIPLLDDPWVILTRRDSELAAAEVPSFDLLDGVDVVAWNRRWRTQVELEKAWRRRAISPRVVYRTDDNLALQRLVAAGYGHACLDRLGAAGAVEPSLTWLEPKEILVPRTIALCCPRHRDPSAEALTLMEAVQAQFGA
ncbi:MAG TPA: LysR family transcriptional regulator [Solirubrobacteraceae bacterium]|jgi:DNA-binding transcriptional LysR family regulator|nr:LysR family transcriptional regulator [Solirubrobacteraceae bacterium]